MQKVTRRLSKVYLDHGKKKLLGVPITVNGRRAIGYVEGQDITSYMYWDDICRIMYNEKLPEYKLGY